MGPNQKRPPLLSLFLSIPFLLFPWFPTCNSFTAAPWMPMIDPPLSHVVFPLCPPHGLLDFLSPSQPLYLSAIAFLSLPFSSRWPSTIHGDGDYMCQRRRFRRRRLVRGQVRWGQFMAVAARATHVAKSWHPGLVLQSLATPTAGSGFKHTHLDLLFKMIPSVPNESARIVGTLFSWKK